MTVLDVILTALKILGDESLYAHISNENSTATGYENDVELLIIAYNQAITSVGVYFPFSHVENLTSENGKIKYEKFTYNPYKILSVTPKICGSEYKILPTEIVTDSDITVEYNYYLSNQTYEDKFPYENTVVTDVCVAYGLLAEYLLYKGRYDESATYLDKFVSLLKTFANYKKKSKIKARKWY